MTEMPLAEHTHMIKALPSDGTDQSFNKYVLPGERRDVGRSRMPIDQSLWRKISTIVTVPITN
jgi:hypothetical protein